MLFRSNFIPDMVRYQLGVILEYIFLSVKFYGALKLSSKSVNVFQILLNKKSEKVRFCSSFGSSRTVNLSGILPCGIQTLYLWFVIQL